MNFLQCCRLQIQAEKSWLSPNSHATVVPCCLACQYCGMDGTELAKTTDDMCPLLVGVASSSIMKPVRQREAHAMFYIDFSMSFRQMVWYLQQHGFTT